MNKPDNRPNVHLMMTAKQKDLFGALLGELTLSQQMALGGLMDSAEKQGAEAMQVKPAEEPETPA